MLSWSEDHTLRLWNVATCEQIGPSMKHGDYVNGALLLENGQRILSWSDDKTLRLWDVVTGEQIGPSMTHGDYVTGALPLENGQRILSWSDDKTLRLWDVVTGEQIGPPMKHEDSVKGALLIGDGQRILSWSEDGSLQVWDNSWKGQNLFELACSYWRPERDLKTLSQRYGITITEPICLPSKTIPRPDWSSIERIGIQSK
jgi:WD40 repeat protein